MTDEDIERIYRISSDKISETSLALKRYAYNDINWDCRLIGLRGARGVGKTTLLLQKILESGVERDMSLYLSLDNVWLDVKEIYLLAEYHLQHGGTRLVLDEVHYVKDWQRIIKNIYDDFSGLFEEFHFVDVAVGLDAPVMKLACLVFEARLHLNRLTGWRHVFSFSCVLFYTTDRCRLRCKRRKRHHQGRVFHPCAL